MAKFDKNIKNEFLNEEDLYEEDYEYDAEDEGYAEEEYQDFSDPDDTEVFSDTDALEPELT